MSTRFEDVCMTKGLGTALLLVFSCPRQKNQEGANEWQLRHTIAANWCGYKRLFRQLLDNSESSSRTDALSELEDDYFVLLEDDVVIGDPSLFTKGIEDFLLNYRGAMYDTWDLLQLDPFGETCDSHVIDRFRQKPVWKPHSGTCPGWEQYSLHSKEGQYFGSQAVIVKKASLQKIVDWMQKSPSIPIESIMTRMPGAIAYGPGICKSAKQTGHGNDL